jgi:hypothetical protein
VNYLVPIGARFSATSEVKDHAVAAEGVLARMDDSGMDVKLLLLDACRDHPLRRSVKGAFSGIRMKLSVHGLYEDAGFPLVLQTLAQ